MVLAIALIIFVIGCCLSSFEDASYDAQRNAQRRHEELMNELRQAQERDAREVRQTKVTRRRVVKDKQGNILAEEITGEIV